MGLPLKNHLQSHEIPLMIAIHHRKFQEILQKSAQSFPSAFQNIPLVH